MMRRSTLLVMAVLMAGASPAAAQGAGLETRPTCAEQGISRVAMTVPPGRTEDEIRQALASSNLFPAGTEVHLLEPVEHPGVTNYQQFRPRVLRMLQNLLRQELQIEGIGTTLVELDENGRVTDVHPTSGNRTVDRQLRDLWRFAEFSPVAVGGCRVKAWVHVRTAFNTEDQYYENQRMMEVQVVP